MGVVRKKMLIKYWDDMYSIGHMALFIIGCKKLFGLRHFIFVISRKV